METLDRVRTEANAPKEKPHVSAFMSRPVTRANRRATSAPAARPTLSTAPSTLSRRVSLYAIARHRGGRAGDGGAGPPARVSPITRRGRGRPRGDRTRRVGRRPGGPTGVSRDPGVRGEGRAQPAQIAPS